MSQNRQLAAILFADIAGYTAMMQHHEEDAMQKLRHFKEELTEKVMASGGSIIQYYGDGCLITFLNALDAVECAKKLQEAFTIEHNIPVRIGIHVGEFLIEEGNIFGDSVNIASRIQSMGVPGGVLFSDTVKNQIKNKPDLLFKSLGQFEFKNVDEKIEVFALANPGFPVPDGSSLVGKFKEPKTERPGQAVSKGTINKRSLLLALAVLIVIISISFLIFQKAKPPGESGIVKDFEQTLPRSIAVLPFADMSPDKSQEYLGDGLADDIISALSGIDSLVVIGRTSSFQFKGKNIDLREIGEKLGVETVLEGSVQKGGNIIRITAQLINVKDGSHIWSQKWDRDMNDLFKVQDEIANGIKEKLQVSMIRDRRTSAPSNAAAYEDFLKGRRLLLTGLPENVVQSRDYFLNALDKDPAFADATAFLSLAYWRLGTFIYPAVEEDRRKKALDSSSKFARKAISLDERSAAAHLAMASYYMYNYDWINAEKEYRRAHELGPGTVEKNFLAEFLSDMGEYEEAVKLAKEALLIDPLDLNSMLTYAVVLKKKGYYKEAIQELEKITRIDSNFMKAYGQLGHCYVGLNKPDEALKSWAHQHEAYGNNELAAIYRKSDFRTAMQAWIKQSTTRDAPISSGEYTIAIIYSYFKDKDNTFKYLELAAEKKLPTVIGVKAEKSFDFLKDDPRYKAYYRKIGLNRYDEYKKNQ